MKKKNPYIVRKVEQMLNKDKPARLAQQGTVWEADLEKIRPTLFCSEICPAPQFFFFFSKETRDLTCLPVTWKALEWVLPTSKA